MPLLPIEVAEEPVPPDLQAGLDRIRVESADPRERRVELVPV